MRAHGDPSRRGDGVRTRIATSIRIKLATVSRIAALAEKLETDKTAVIERAIKELAERHKIR